MRRAARTDQNHSQIVAALRALGWLVKSTAAVGDGFPDLVIAKQGRVLLLEVKDGAKVASRRQLTLAERRVREEFWHQARVNIFLVETVADVEAL